ncbi:hypothetical protein [Microbacterium oxydans]|uniref:hypothetical protein n=1 Tax=Microbacterium oxydans TaxID=82380 RepID=UPI00226B6BE8|nr:hypothetical protein [Microbacterium oxydans]WAA65647.1 hypothetical protein MME74_15650 [Microbacterium oxydans]
MRENGVDMPDPEPGSNGISIGQSSGDIDQSVIQEASEKCIEKLGDAPPMSPDEQAAADKEMLKWAKEAAECYREHGYDVPDPQDSKSITFPSDATQEVIEECGGGQMAQTKDAP